MPSRSESPLMRASRAAQLLLEVGCLFRVRPLQINFAELRSPPHACLEQNVDQPVFAIFVQLRLNLGFEVSVLPIELRQRLLRVIDVGSRVRHLRVVVGHLQQPGVSELVQRAGKLIHPDIHRRTQHELDLHAIGRGLQVHAHIGHARARLQRVDAGIHRLLSQRLVGLDGDHALHSVVSHVRTAGDLHRRNLLPNIRRHRHAGKFLGRRTGRQQH